MFKNWKLILFSAIVFSLIVAHWHASAEPFVCITKSPQARANDEALIQTVAVRCENLGRMRTSLNATAIVFSGAGLAAACTVIGAPATVWLEGAAIGIQAVELIVGQLPCDNRTRDAEVKALAQQVVCAQLAANGIVCKL
jgi:hypothetical protein